VVIVLILLFGWHESIHDPIVIWVRQWSFNSWSPCRRRALHVDMGHGHWHCLIPFRTCGWPRPVGRGRV